MITGLIAAVLAASTMDAPLTPMGDAAMAQAAPERLEVASKGDFKAIQIATVDQQRLEAEWAIPGAGAHLSTDSQMKRNQPIITFVVFGGCKANSEGNCVVVGTFDVTDPLGKPYAHEEDAKLWVDHPAPPAGVLQLSEGALGLMIEDKDPLGPYRVKVTVTDKIAGVVLHTESVLTAVP